MGSILEWENDFRTFCTQPTQPVQPTLSKEMEELRKLLGDTNIPEDMVRLYGGEQRFLEKFLIGRDFKVKESYQMILDALETMKKYPLDPPNMDAAEKAKYDIFLSLWPVTFTAVSKKGNLVLFTKLRDIRPKKFMSELEEEQIKRFFCLYGRQSMLLQNFCNARFRPEGETEWARTVEVFDLKGISTKQLAVKGLKLLARVLKVGQNLFPDTLAKSFIINAPWYFSAAWQVIKLGLHKRTIERVSISRGTSEKALEALLGSKELVATVLEGKGKQAFLL